MQNGLYVAVSAQVALERRLETIADNIANMNTVGYRATGVSFEAEMAKAGETTLNYVSSGSDYLSRRVGGLIKTDNPLDFAVQGDGWFGIQTPAGIAYTRDGRARIDESGTLRTLNGDPILDAGGAPILVDGAAGPLTVSSDGMINQNGRQVGAIGLFAIDPDANLDAAENSGVIPDKPATPDPRFHPRRRRSGRGRELECRSRSRDDAADRSDARLRRGRRRGRANRGFAAGRHQDARVRFVMRRRRPMRQPLPALERLERRVAWGLRNLQAARVSGLITEVVDVALSRRGAVAFPQAWANASASMSATACRSARSSRSTTPPRR